MRVAGLRDARVLGLALVAMMVLGSLPYAPEVAAAEAPGGGLHLASAADVRKAGGSGAGTEADPWVLSGLHAADPNGTALTVHGLHGHLILRDLHLNGRILLHASDLESLTVDGLRGNATGQGVGIHNVSHFTARNWEIRSAGTGVALAEIHHLDTRFVNVTARDAMFLTEVHGNVTLGTLRAEHRGVTAAEFSGVIQNVNVLECAGTGFLMHGGHARLIGNGAECREAGFHLVEMSHLEMEGNAVAHAEVGYFLHDSEFTSTGDVARHVREGFQLADVEGELIAPEIEDAVIGILIEGGKVSVSEAVVRGAAEAAIHAVGAELSEGEGSYERVHIGLDLVGSTLDRLPGGPPSVVKQALIGARFSGTRTTPAGWRGLDVHTCDTGLEVLPGSDLKLQELDLTDCRAAGSMREGGKLEIEGGSWSVVEGFTLGEGATLRTERITAGRMEGPFVRANESRVEDDGSVIGSATLNSNGVAFDLRASVADLRDTHIHRATTGIRLSGQAVGPEGAPLQASRLVNVKIERSGLHGIHLKNASVAEVQGGLISRANFRNPLGAGHGILAEEQSALVLGGGLRIEFAFGDGIHWTGVPAVPRSSLFPADSNDRPSAYPRIEDVVLHGNSQDGLWVADVPKEAGFTVRKLVSRFNSVNGARLSDVHVSISDSLFGEHLPCASAICFNTALGNRADGLFAIWNGAAGAEFLEIHNTTFQGNERNGLTLWKHGAGTRITASTFDRNGKICAVLSCPGEGGADLRDGHALLVEEPTGPGPLLHGSLLQGNINCDVRANGNVRVVKNNISKVNTDPSCGVHVRNASAAEVHENVLSRHSHGIAFMASSGTIIGNRVNDTWMTSIMVVGTGTETVTVRDNTLLGAATSTLVVFCGLDCLAYSCGNGAVCWSQARGTIERNRFDTGENPCTGLCLTRAAPAIMVYRASGEAIPEIFQNDIATYQTGIELFDDTTHTGSTGTSVGRSYEGTNRIHDNRFTARPSVGGDPAAARAVAIQDRHGVYDSSDRSHAAPTGANVRNNAYATGIFVPCHTYTVDSATVIDAAYPCDESGKLRVESHDFGPVGTSAEVGPRSPPVYDPPPPPGTRERPGFSTEARPPGYQPCGGYFLPYIDSFKARRVPNAGREFSINASIPWVESIPYMGKMCDALSDIKIKVSVDGTVIRTLTAAEMPNHFMEFRHTFPQDKLYELELEVTLNSKSPALRNQRQVDRDAAWAGQGPRLRELSVEFGTAFLKGVPIPGGVTVQAEVFWPSSSEGLVGKVLWQAGGYEWESLHIIGEREVSTTFQPGVNVDIVGLEDTVILQAQALALTLEGDWLASNVETTRLKLVAFPAALALVMLPAETEAQIVLKADGGKALAYKWEWVLVKFGKVEAEVTAPVIAGEYEMEYGLGAKMTANSEGGGSFGVQSGFAVKGEPESKRWDFSAALKGDANALVQMDDVRLTGGSLVLKAEMDLMFYMFASDLVPAFKLATRAPLLGSQLTELDKSLRVGLGLGLEGEGNIAFEWAKGFRCGGLRDDWRCSGEVVIKPRLTGKLVLEADDEISATLYAKISPYWSATSETARPGDLLGPGKHGVEAEAGLQVAFFSWERTWKVLATVEFRSPGVGGSEESDSGWTIPARTWTDGGTYGGADREVVGNLTRFGTPAVAFNGETALAVWVKDDLNAPHPRGGEIVAAFRNATGAWRELGVLSTDDADLLDARPSVAALANGRFVVAWSRDTNAALSPSTPLDAVATRTYEVMAMVVDPTATNRPAPTRLTNDALLDAAVRVVPGADGSAAILWSKHLSDPAVENAHPTVESWAARVTSGGTLQAPVRILPETTSLVRESGWASGKLWLAEIHDKNLSLRSTDLVTVSAATSLGSIGEAPPVLALRADSNSRYVAWLRVNLTNASRLDLVESQINTAGTVTTRQVATGVLPGSLAYGAGTAARSLTWVERRGDGDAVWRATFDLTAWSAPTRVLTSPHDLALLAARSGADTSVAVVETELRNVTRTFNYSGTNTEGSEQVTFSRDISTVERGPSAVRLLRPPPALPAPRPVEPLEATLVSTSARGTNLTVTATIANHGANTSQPRPATLLLGPWEGATAVRATVTLPAIPPGTVGFLEATVPAPDGTGWWTAQLEAPRLESAVGAVRLAPEWRLPLEEVGRDGTTVTFRLHNEGLRAGATSVRVHEILVNGDLGPQLAATNVTVSAGGSSPASLQVPAAAGALLLIANPPGGTIDQTDFAATVAVVPGGPGVFELAGSLALPAGTHPFRLDLARFAGAYRVASAALDGAPLAFTVDRGVVSGSVTLTPGAHRLVVLAEDLFGIERELVVTIQAGAGGGGGGPGGGSGGQDNGTKGVPDPVKPWWQRLLPGPEGALLLAAVAAAALALGTRRRAR